jgi:hypothetical protein
VASGAVRGRFLAGQGGSFNEDQARWWLSGDAKTFLRVCYVAVTRAQPGLDDQKLSWI